MDLPEALLRELVVTPGSAADLQHRDTRETKTTWLGKPTKKDDKAVAVADLDAFKTELQRVQQLLYANGTWAMLLVFQALDAAGKDGTISHVMSGVNPQGCSVTSFKRPSEEELRHNFLWRCARALPERGHIGIFNRSYYEEVLVVRVHPDLLAEQHLPAHRGAGKELWNERYEDINAFERHLDRNGIRIVKFFLHVSKDEQRRRFLARLDDPQKRWKFSAADVAERQHFDEYMRAYEAALTATSTKHAPWYVIPADNKPTMRAMVAGVVVHVVDQLGLSAPEPATTHEEREAARAALLAEGN
ncbi:MAG TPA: PPK2 family polyphosphate kinase [Mycobacteriales bacterium]|nr:PPK2 family polyphosphate kinase [Mycobacteriales bacterium]